MLYQFPYNLLYNPEKNLYELLYKLGKFQFTFYSKVKISSGDCIRILPETFEKTDDFAKLEVELAGDLENLPREAISLITTIYPLDAKESYHFHSINKSCSLLFKEQSIFKVQDAYENCSYLFLITSTVNQECFFDWFCSKSVNSSLRFYVNVME